MIGLQTISDKAKALEQKQEEVILPTNGLVAFFDVLGYKDIISNNEISEAVRIIRNLLFKIPKKFEQEFPTFQHIEKSLLPSHLIFSDSILIYTPLDSPPFGDQGYKDMVSDRFVHYCREMLAYSFLAGLPLRGAIARGDYYIKDSCFAGKPIVEAYTLGNLLDLSGCALTLGTEDEIPFSKDASEMFFGCDIPLKGHGKQKLFMLDYYPALKRQSPAIRKNFRKNIVAQFKAHKKRIGVEVFGKINNTLDFLKKCKSRKHRGIFGNAGGGGSRKSRSANKRLK